MENNAPPGERAMKIGDAVYRLPPDFVQPPLPFDPVKQAELAAMMARKVAEAIANSDGKTYCQKCMDYRPSSGSATQFTCPDCGQRYQLDGCWPGTFWEAC